MNYAIISIYSTPFGMAPTSRIMSYSKGLVYNGATITIYNPFPTDNWIKKDRLERKGQYEGVHFNYTSGRYLLKNKVFRGLYRVSGLKTLVGYISSAIALIKSNKKSKIDGIIISTDSLRNLFFYSIISSLLNSKSVFIFDEFPTPIRHKLKSRIPLWKIVAFKLVLRNFSAYISISKNLSDYFNKISTHNTFILPVIVDISRFETSCISKNKCEEYLCYMGNMELSKDDVDNIIKAFSLISKEFSSLKLLLFGDPTMGTKNILNELISSLDLTEKIKLKGKINSFEVPEILKNAKILVSSQPNTVRASGGFPTKLGEYLASGTPALFTDVGENSKYVKDGVHLFFAKSGNPNDYAIKLRYILNNYEKAQKMAKEGKGFVFENYSHEKQGMYLLEFLKSI